MIRLLLAAVVGITIGHHSATTPDVRCHEDEVIVWTGDAHTRCVPLDDIQEAAVDLYTEAVIQAEAAR